MWKGTWGTYVGSLTRDPQVKRSSLPQIGFANLKVESGSSRLFCCTSWQQLITFLGSLPTATTILAERSAPSAPREAMSPDSLKMNKNSTKAVFYISGGGKNYIVGFQFCIKESPLELTIPGDPPCRHGSWRPWSRQTSWCHTLEWNWITWAKLDNMFNKWKFGTYGFCWSSLFISMDGSKYSVGSGSTAPLTSLMWPEE